MISAFVNTFKIPELRDRIFLTLFLIFIARMCANIPLPGINPQPINDFLNSQANEGASVLGLYNMFTGGALLRGAIGALGIMPYISASIIFQMLGAVTPSLSRLMQEGEVGRQKITQYTRYLTVGICLVQGVLLVLSLMNPEKLFGGGIAQFTANNPIILTNPTWFLITSVIFLTAGTVLLMWLGEQITQRGIGNGISILITVGILADLPGAIAFTWRMFFPDVILPEGQGMNLADGVLLFVILVLVVAGIVAVTQAQRKIPVQYAKRVVGRRVYGGQSSFLPLKVNYSGVMPVIFASAILLFVQTISSGLASGLGWGFMQGVTELFSHGSWGYYVLFGGLIFMLSYVWVSLMFKPIQIADDLKKYGGYVPGVRPGEPTARFLDFVMTRLTLAGAAFLTVIAVFPDVIFYFYRIPFQTAQFFGGTGMLIIVGVLLDFLRQVETYLLQRHYDGFLKKGRIKGRSVGRTKQLVDTSAVGQGSKLWWALAGVVVIGAVAWSFNAFGGLN